MPLNEHDQYWIAREGTTFGPYSAAEVRDYLRSGNIVPSDTIKGASDADWTTVAVAMRLTAAPPMPAPPAESAAVALEDPNSHSAALWGLGLGIAGFLCCGPFTAVPGLFLSISAMRSKAYRTHQYGLAGVVVNVVAIILGCFSMCVLYAFLAQLGTALEEAAGGAMRGMP